PEPVPRRCDPRAPGPGWPRPPGRHPRPGRPRQGDPSGRGRPAGLHAHPRRLRPEAARYRAPPPRRPRLLGFFIDHDQPRAMIRVEDLVKKYGAFTAVDGVSLDVAPGEIHGFLGPNGAGKTTTIRLIAGLLKPTRGRIVIDGQDLATSAEAAKASLGFIPDRPFIYEKLTAGEFLRFHGGLYGMDGDGIGHRVAEVLALFELTRWEG